MEKSYRKIEERWQELNINVNDCVNFVYTVILNDYTSMKNFQPIKHTQI
mgnify:CR=1 FL=1